MSWSGVAAAEDEAAELGDFVYSETLRPAGAAFDQPLALG